MTEPVHEQGPFAQPVSADRARVRDAAIALVVERGSPAVGIDALCERAGVGRPWFEAEFESVDDCLTRIYLANVAEFDRLVFAAVAEHESWRPRLRAAAYAAARYVEARPLETRFDMVQMLASGHVAMAERDRYVDRIVDLIDEGRGELEDPDSMQRAVAVGVFGAIYEMLAKRTGEGGPVGPEAFVPELMYIAVRPYLGHEAAVEELEMPAPPERTHG